MLSTKPDEPQTIYIRPVSGWASLNLGDIWRYRELVYFLTWRDIKVRYKQTLLGASWAILRPLLTMVVFSIFFGGLAKISSDGFPYPVYTYTALLPWELFATALSIASRSLVGNANMITKIYFPRMILPMSSVLGGLVDFAIAFIVLIGLMIGYGITPTAAVWTLPLFILLAVITALGFGLWLSALNVLYRDIGYVIPFLTQMWLFITPVVYPTSMLPESWRFVYALNPMTGVVDGFRWALLGNQQSAPGATLIISSIIAVLVLVSGMFYFRRMERQFADMV